LSNQPTSPEAAGEVREMMQQYRSNSYLFGGNAPYVEELYEAYLDNPGSVPDSWRSYFDALQHVPANDGSETRDVAHAPVVESFAQRFVKMSRSALSLSKKLFYSMDGLSFPEALAAGVDINATARMTKDCRAGVARFLEK
jgi:hypothetical protein